MLTPQQFQINEAWIAVRANDAPFYIQHDPCDCHILMDACSTYVFGFVFSKRDEAPDGSEIASLLVDAWRNKNQWTQKLIVTGDGQAECAFRTQAEKMGLVVETIPVSDMTPIVAPMKASFMSMLSSKSK